MCLEESTRTRKCSGAHPSLNPSIQPGCYSKNPISLRGGVRDTFYSWLHLQWLWFTPMFICQSFFALKTGCFVFHLSLITHGAISHRHPEMAHRILEVLGPAARCQFLKRWTDRQDGVMTTRKIFFKDREWDLCPFMGSRVEVHKSVSHNKFTKAFSAKTLNKNEHFLSTYCSVQRSSADWLTDWPNSRYVCEQLNLWDLEVMGSTLPG